MLLNTELTSRWFVSRQNLKGYKSIGLAWTTNLSALPNHNKTTNNHNITAKLNIIDMILNKTFLISKSRNKTYGSGHAWNRFRFTKLAGPVALYNSPTPTVVIKFKNDYQFKFWQLLNLQNLCCGGSENSSYMCVLPCLLNQNSISKFNNNL